MPPLRERPEDIPLLVRHYMDYFSRENNTRPRRISQAALEALQRYRWKGNIRELRNTVERLIIMSPGDTIDLADLPGAIRSPQAAGAIRIGAARRRRCRRRPAGTLREFKDNAERAFLVAKLRENGWNISKTAEADRHAAQQSVQEARAVPDFAGNRRIAASEVGTQNCRSQNSTLELLYVASGTLPRAQNRVRTDLDAEGDRPPPTACEWYNPGVRSKPDDRCPP